MGQTRPFFVYVNSFSECNDKYSTKFNNKSLDGVFGFRTLDNRMVAADESTELSWPPQRVRVPEEKRKMQVGLRNLTKKKKFNPSCV